jgi:Zn-dependent protease with chaperone function
MSNKLLILLFITSFTYSSYSQGFIKPMLCEGKLPLDLKNSIEDIVNNKKLNAFNKKNLLSVYEIFSSGKVVYGNETWKMLDRIGKKIIHSNNLDTNVRFYILRSGAYNAFATDEGFIFATTALLSQITNEDELAFIICHELSHYILKHNTQSYIENRIATNNTLRDLKKEKKLEDVEFNYKLLDDYLKKYYQFSRKKELEADSLGLILFRNCNYDINNALSSISKLKDQVPLASIEIYNPNYIEPNTDTSKLKSSKILEYIDSFDFELNLLNDKDNLSNNIYETHPEWSDRYDKIKSLNDNISKKTISISQEISREIKLQCYSEMFLQHLKQEEYVIALSYLLFIEKEFGINNEIQQWKGVCLSNLFYMNRTTSYIKIDESLLIGESPFLSDLLNHTMSWNDNEAYQIAQYYNSKFLVNNEVGILNKFHYEKLNKIKKNKKTTKKSDQNKFLDSSNIEFLYTISKHGIEFDSSFLSQKDWINTEYRINNIPFTSDPFSGDTYLPTKSNSNIIDSMILLSPNLQFENSNSNYAFNNPLYHSSKRKLLSNELIFYGNTQNIHYTNLDFDNKQSLSTESYNHYYFFSELIAEIAKTNYSKNIPLSVIYSNKLISETKCNKLHFIQLEYSNTIKNPSLGSAIAELAIFPLSILVFSDFYGFREQFKVYLKITNLIIDLKSMNIEYLANYNSSLRLKNDNISVISQKIQSDTKKQLSK